MSPKQRSRGARRVGSGRGPERGLVAHAAVVVDAPPARVWEALTDPEKIRRYLFGSTVVTDWREGHPIVWKGEWQGRPYEDKGVILEYDPPHRIVYSHFSPLLGLPDIPDNYHTVTVELAVDGPRTRVSLTQDRNDTEEARAHSEGNWRLILDGLKLVVEGAAGGR